MQYREEATYSSDAVNGVIGDLCHVLGLDRRKVRNLVIRQGHVIAEVEVEVKQNNYPKMKSIELMGFPYESSVVPETNSA